MMRSGRTRTSDRFDCRRQDRRSRPQGARSAVNPPVSCGSLLSL